MSGTALWAAVLAGSLGCYLLKLAGLSVPAAWVEQPWVARIVDFVPAALLAALVAVQAATSGQELVLDGRLVGLAVAALALALRAPFIVVLLLAGAPARSCTSSRAEARRSSACRCASRALAEAAAEAPLRTSRSSRCSRSSRNRLRASPPPKPTRLPSAPITRWQGTTIGSGLRPHAAPTAWAQRPVADGRGPRRRRSGWRRTGWRDQLCQTASSKWLPDGAQRQVERRPVAGEVLASCSDGRRRTASSARRRASPGRAPSAAPWPEAAPGRRPPAPRSADRSGRRAPRASSASSPPSGEAPTVRRATDSSGRRTPRSGRSTRCRHGAGAHRPPSHGGARAAAARRARRHRGRRRPTSRAGAGRPTWAASRRPGAPSPCIGRFAPSWRAAALRSRRAARRRRSRTTPGRRRSSTSAGTAGCWTSGWSVARRRPGDRSSPPGGRRAGPG